MLINDYVVVVRFNSSGWPIVRGAGWIMDHGLAGFEIHQIHNPWI